MSNADRIRRNPSPAYKTQTLNFVPAVYVTPKNLAYFRAMEGPSNNEEANTLVNLPLDRPTSPIFQSAKTLFSDFKEVYLSDNHHNSIKHLKTEFMSDDEHELLPWKENDMDVELSESESETQSDTSTVTLKTHIRTTSYCPDYLFEPIINLRSSHFYAHSHPQRTDSPMSRSGKKERPKPFPISFHVQQEVTADNLLDPIVSEDWKLPDGEDWGLPELEDWTRSGAKKSNITLTEFDELQENILANIPVHRKGEDHLYPPMLNPSRFNTRLTRIRAIFNLNPFCLNPSNFMKIGSQDISSKLPEYLSDENSVVEGFSITRSSNPSIIASLHTNKPIFIHPNCPLKYYKLIPSGNTIYITDASKLGFYEFFQYLNEDMYYCVAENVIDDELLHELLKYIDSSYF